jgi:hypothetical protein
MKSKTSAPAGASLAAGPLLPVAAGSRPPHSLEERLQCIEAMGRQIEEYIQYLRQVVGSSGTSVEAKERTVAVFYERLAAAQQQLHRIQEDLRLT